MIYRGAPLGYVELKFKVKEVVNFGNRKRGLGRVGYKR